MSAQVCFNFIIILNKMAYNSNNVLTIYILTSRPGISFTTCNTVTSLVLGDLELTTL